MSCRAKMCAICRGSNHTYPRSSSPWAIEFRFAFGESRASLAQSPTYGTHFRLARHGRHDSDLKNNICLRRENSYCVIPDLDDPRRWNPRTSVASGQWLLGRPRVQADTSLTGTVALDSTNLAPSPDFLPFYMNPRWLAHPTPISHKVRSDWTPNCWRRLGTCPDEFSFLG